MSEQWDVPSESDGAAWSIDNVTPDTVDEIVAFVEAGNRAALSRDGKVVAVMVHPAELDAMFARYGRMVWDLQREVRLRKRAEHDAKRVEE